MNFVSYRLAERQGEKSALRSDFLINIMVIY